MSLFFNGEVTANFQEPLKDVLSATLGVLPDRMINGQIVEDRRLQDTEPENVVLTTNFLWDIPPMRGRESITPSVEG